MTAIEPIVSQPPDGQARRRRGALAPGNGKAWGLACVSAMLLSTSSQAASAMSYTNWPSVKNWTDLTNHISWCNKALSERLTVVGRASETNDIAPSFTWPCSDYVRFAEKIDSLATNFVCQAMDRDDHFKAYLTTQTGCQYPLSLPRWAITNLHVYAFSKEQWTTNSPLHSWLGMTNHAIQVEVQNAITCLVWTAVDSSEREDHAYFRCSQFGRNASEKTEPCYCNDDPYPSGYTNAISLARSFEINRWAGGAIVSGEMGWGNAIYAVGSMLSVIYPTYVVPDYTYTVYGARMYAKPVLENVRTDYVARASVFLKMRHFGYEGYSNYRNYWFTYDYNSSWFGGRLVETNHLVFAQELVSSRARRRVGDYPFYDRRLVNPLTESYVDGATVRTCDHIYCDEAQWLLKWDVAGGLDLAPPPIGSGAVVAETPDVDRDDIVDVAADLSGLGRDTGSIVAVPECDRPVVLLPLASPPSWFGSLLVHAYLSQGAFTNLPYAYHVKPHADDDGYYTAYSLNTRVEESGAVSDRKLGFQKRAEVVRPRGNVVIFDFACEKGTFSDKGYPVGFNKQRSYVLRDLTPGVHTDRKFELCFASGIVHEFDDGGNLSAVRHADGRRVEACRTSLPSAAVAFGPADSGPTSAVGACYAAAVRWDRGTPVQIDYATLLPPVQTVSAVVSLDDNKFIRSVSKNDVFAKSDASVSGSTVTYGSGIKIRRTATGKAGAARAVTLATEFPGVGTRTDITEFDSADRVVRSELSTGSGPPAVTRYGYQGGMAMTRYANGFLKSSKVARITGPDGATETFEYTANEGWPLKRTAPSGAGFDRVSLFSYDTYGDFDAPNVTSAVERPRKVETKIGNTVVSRTFYGYKGSGETAVRVCTAADAAWDSAGNIRSTSLYDTDGLTDGLLREYTSAAIAADCETRVLTVEGGYKLKTVSTRGDGKTVTTVVNAFGTQESSMTVDEGRTAGSSSSTVDPFGRPLETTFLDLTTLVNADYGFYGPATVTGVDGSTSVYTYFDHGPVKSVVDHSTDRITTYDYDVSGNAVKTTVSGGGKTRVSEAAYDALGRLTFSADGLGGQTKVTYETTSFGVRATTQPPSGGTLVEETNADGSARRTCGSAAPARVSHEYGVEGASFYHTARNDDHEGEYTKEYFNFLGRPARVKRSGTAGETVIRYDSAGRRIGSADESGVATVQTYDDVKNLPQHAALDVDRNGTADLAGSDAVVTSGRTVTDDGVRYETQSYQSDGDGTPFTASSSTVSFDGLSGSFTEFGRSGSFEQTRLGAQGTYDETVQNSDGTATTRSYVKWRLDSAVTRSAGGRLAGKIEYRHDGLGRLESVREYRNGTAWTTRYDRDEKGRVKSALRSDGSPGLSSVTYDGATERVKRIVRTDGTAVSYDFDPVGRLTREYDIGVQDKRYDYDALGRLTALTVFRDGTAQTTRWNYDNVTGRLLQKVVGNTVAESYAYLDNGMPSAVTDANGVTVTLSRDNGGRVAGATASDGTAAVSISLDRLGHAAAVADPAGISVARTVSPEGLVLAETVSGNGIVADAAITRSYADATHGGLLRFACAVQGGPTNDVRVGYDDAARVASVSNGSASATFLYPDDAPLATSVVVRAGARVLTRAVGWDFENVRPLAVSYAADGAGARASYAYAYVPGARRVAAETLSDGTARTFGYDTRGRLLSSCDYLTDGTRLGGRSFAYAYDSAGNVLRAGPPGASGGPRYSFACDSRDIHVLRVWGNVFEISGTAVPGATVRVGDKIAERQGDRFRASVTVDNAASAVRTNIAVTAFLRDPVQGRDVVACATGTLFVAKASETPGYGADAALAADSRFAYSWDAFGRLASAVSASGPDVRLDFRYYPDGRRASKTVSQRSGAAWAPVRAHQYHYDAWNLVCETVRLTPLDAANPPVTLVRRYLWGPDLAGQRSGRCGQDAGGIGGLLAVTVTSNGTDTVYLSLTDGLGNVRGLADAQTGALAAEYAYDPYGAPLEAGGDAADLCPFRFQTKYFDAETGLYCFGYRYYDPLSCKWLRRDPKGEAGGVNLTAFCDGDPVNGHDPLGLAPMVYNWLDPATGIPHFGIADSYDVHYLGFERAVVNGETVPRDMFGTPVADGSLMDLQGDSLRMLMGDGAAETLNALGAFAPLAAVGVSTVILGVGETQDLFVLCSKDSTGFDRVLSLGSLALSVVSLGATPNYGGSVRAGKRVLAEAAETADDFFSTLKRIPQGTSFNGTIWRYEFPERIRTTWQAGEWNVKMSHRYSAEGMGATYGGLTKATARHEVGIEEVLLGRVATKKRVSVSNVLDLREESTRRQLGVSLLDITGKSYERTQRIGKWAVEHGYNGILAPSSRFEEHANLVIFGGL